MSLQQQSCPRCHTRGRLYLDWNMTSNTVMTVIDIHVKPVLGCGVCKLELHGIVDNNSLYFGCTTKDLEESQGARRIA